MAHQPGRADGARLQHGIQDDEPAQHVLRLGSVPFPGPRPGDRGPAVRGSREHQRQRRWCALWPGGIRTKVNVSAMGGVTTGRVSYEGAGRSYESTRIDSIVASGSGATVFGAFGSVLFRLDIHDGGSGGEDTLRLRTSDGFDSGVLTNARGELVVRAN